MYFTDFPVIDLKATGENIKRLRKARGLSVKDVQNFFGFENPQAIYKWQSGKSLPTVDNLFALRALLGVPMDAILVPYQSITHNIKTEQPAMQPAALNFYTFVTMQAHTCVDLVPYLIRLQKCIGDTIRDLPETQPCGNPGPGSLLPQTILMDFSISLCLHQSYRKRGISF